MALYVSGTGGGRFSSSCARIWNTYGWNSEQFVCEFEHVSRKLDRALDVLLQDEAEHREQRILKCNHVSGAGKRAVSSHVHND